MANMTELFLPGDVIRGLGCRVESGLVLAIEQPEDVIRLLGLVIHVYGTAARGDGSRSLADAAEEEDRIGLRVLAGQLLATPSLQNWPAVDPAEVPLINELVQRHVEARILRPEGDHPEPSTLESLILSLNAQHAAWLDAERHPLDGAGKAPALSARVSGRLLLLVADPLEGTHGQASVHLDRNTPFLTSTHGSLLSGLAFYSVLKTRSWLTGLTASIVSVGWRAPTPAAQHLVERTRARAIDAGTLFEIPRLDKLSDADRARLCQASVVVVCVHGLFSTDMGTFDGVLQTLGSTNPYEIIDRLKEQLRQLEDAKQSHSRGLQKLSEDLDALQESLAINRPKGNEIRKKLKKEILNLWMARRIDLDYLNKLGIVAVGFPHNTLAPIKSNAQQLKRLLKEVLSDDVRANVVFLCHSRGGLVARYAAANLAKDPSWRTRLVDLITFGTPHAGAALAEATDARDAAAYLLGLNATRKAVSVLDVCAYLREYEAAGITDLRPGGHQGSYIEELEELEDENAWLCAALAVGGVRPPASDWPPRKRAAAAFLCWRTGTHLHDLVVERASSLWLNATGPARLEVRSDHFSYFERNTNTELGLDWASARILRQVDWHNLPLYREHCTEHLNEHFEDEVVVAG